jgi:hypothetical protein
VTNKERLISLLGFSADNNAVEGALLDAGIEPGDSYVAESSLITKGAAIEVLKILLSTPDTTMENANSVRYDRNAILKRIAQLEYEIGIEDVSAPKVTFINPW